MATPGFAGIAPDVGIGAGDPPVGEVRGGVNGGGIGGIGGFGGGDIGATGFIGGGVDDGVNRGAGFVWGTVRDSPIGGIGHCGTGGICAGPASGAGGRGRASPAGLMPERSNFIRGSCDGNAREGIGVSSRRCGWTAGVTPPSSKCAGLAGGLSSCFAPRSWSAGLTLNPGILLTGSAVDSW